MTESRRQYHYAKRAKRREREQGNKALFVTERARAAIAVLCEANQCKPRIVINDLLAFAAERPADFAAFTAHRRPAELAIAAADGSTWSVTPG